MILTSLSVTILSIVSATLYRLGGIGKPFNTKYRDFGCPLVSIAVMLLLGISAPWYLWLLYFGLSFASMTTYNKWAARIIGKSPYTVYGISWAVTGLFYGLSAFPIVWGDWLGFSLRCGILAITTALWSSLIDKDWLEEGGRGLLFTGTLPLLLIGG